MAAILKITENLIDHNPGIINLLEKYFDSMEFMSKDDNGIKSYLVNKEGLPSGQDIVVVFKANKDGPERITHWEKDSN